MHRHVTPTTATSVTTLVLQASGVVLNLISSILVARGSSEAVFGAYSYSVALATFLASLFSGFFAGPIVRHVATYVAREEWGRLRGLMRRGHQAAFLAATIAVGAGWIFIALRPLEGMDRRVPAASLAVVPLLTLSVYYTAALRGLGRTVVSQVPDQLARPLLQLGLLGGYTFVGPPTAMGLMYLQILAASVTTAAGAALVWGVTPAPAQSAPAVYDDRHWFTRMTPLLLLGRFPELGIELMALVAGQALGVGAAGVYRTASRMAQVISIAAYGLNTAITSHVARLSVLGDTDLLQRLLSRQTKIGALIAVVLALPMLSSGGLLLSLVFGPQFSSGGSALAVLAAGQLMNVLAGPVGMVLVMTGHETESVSGPLLELPTVMMLASLLVTPFGQVGLAVAAAIGVIARNAVQGYYVYRRLGLRCHTWLLSCRWP